jgi:hypothetical protein
MSATLTPKQIADIDGYLDERHAEHEELGRQLFAVFHTDKQGKDNVSTQVRNLQQVAVSATRLADVEDFVKNQMGRTTRTTRSAQDWRRVGPDTLEALAQLREAAGTCCGEVGPEARLQIRLRLARGWVRAVVSEYLYQKARSEMEKTP